MKKQEAVELLRTATSVEDWNQKREVIRTKATLQEWEDLHYTVDGSGLIVEVLGVDAPKPVYSPQPNSN